MNVTLSSAAGADDCNTLNASGASSENAEIRPKLLRDNSRPTYSSNCFPTDPETDEPAARMIIFRRDSRYC